MRRIILYLISTFVWVMPSLGLGSVYAINYVSEIATAAGSSRENCIKQLTDNGYQYIDLDLNKGAGGDYIYMGYKTTTKYTDAITNLIVSEGKSSDTRIDGCDYTMTKCLNGFNGDLNKGAGGKWLYLKYTKGGKAESVPAITKLEIHTRASSGCTYVNGYVNSTLSYTPMDLNKGAGGAYIYISMGKTAYSGSSDVLTNDLSVEYLGAGYYKFVIPVNHRDKQNVLNSISGSVTVCNSTGSALYFELNAAKYYGTECMKDANLQNVDNATIQCQFYKGTMIDYRTFQPSKDNKCLIEGGNHKNHRFVTILWKAPDAFNVNDGAFRIKGKVAVNATGKPSDFSAVILATHPALADAMNAPIVIDPFLNTESSEPGWSVMMVTSTNKMQSLGYIDDTDNTAVSYGIEDNATNATINLQPHDKEHSLVVLSLIKKQEISSDGTQDYGYTLAAVPVTQKAFHTIVKGEEDLMRYATMPSLRWKVEYPHDEDLIADDAFVVERAYSSDFSDANVIGSVAFSDSLRISDDRFANYSFTDEDETGRNNSQSTVQSPIFEQWKNISNTARNALLSLNYPIYYTYYRVNRGIVKSLWANNNDYEVRWRVLNDNVLPTVTKVTLGKGSNWDTEHSVNLTIQLANPYPWEVVSPDDSSAVHAEAIRQNLTRRLYRWSPNARIRVERYSAPEDHYNGVDEAAKIFYISGSDVRFNDKTGTFEALLADNLAAPYTCYYYKAIVDTTYVDWPINAGNTFVTTDRNEWTRFDNIPPVTNLAATQGTVQGQVSLTWDPVDASGITYTIDYRELTTSPETTVSGSSPDGKLATSPHWLPLDTVTDTHYNDTHFSKAGHVYEYRVTANATFRGKTYHSTSVSAIGYNPYYGTIAGKVKLSNGTAMPGNDLSVLISRTSPFHVDEVKDTATGDVIMQGLSQESFLKEIPLAPDGTFSCDSIPYLSDITTTYNVRVQGLNGVDFVNAAGSIGAMQVDISTESFSHTAIDFTCSSVLAFSANVLYNGSTVPVRDVSFSVNGITMKDANGRDITTDNQGRFSFVIPKGMPVAIRADKRGHTFVDGGYLVGSADAKVIPADGFSGKTLYDLTTVRLVGRIIGGELQAKAPLGMAISHNNLGDNLRLELQLEGDNTASIIYDLKNPEKDTRDTLFTQRVKLSDSSPGRESYLDTIPTAVTFQRKRIILSPDVATGEFCIDLFPTKYKITSISATGYSTLTNEGEGFEILDLSNSIDTITADNTDYLISLAAQGIKVTDGRQRTTSYQATYQREYHVPATVTLQQYDKTGIPQPYFGEKTLKEYSLYGERIEVPIVSPSPAVNANPDSQSSTLNSQFVSYAFGYPVFNDQTNYRFRVTAHEDYYYNNDKKRAPEIVNLTGGKLTMYNGLQSATARVEAQLNSKGQADVVLFVNNPCFNLTDTAALRTVNAEVKFNGYYYRSAPIRAFIVGQQDAGTEVMPLDNNVNVVDVVRDPYGTNSYAWRDAGTEYHWDRSRNSIESLNFNIDVSAGGAGTWYIGVGLAEKSSFSIMAGGNVNIPMRKNMSSEYGEYTMTLNERIQTSDDPTMVGAMADVYVGYVDMSHLREVTAMTLTDSAGYSRMQSAISTGAVRVVRQGKDANGKDCWLIVGKKLVVATDSVESTFAYSQKHILGTVIPQLEKRYSELVMNCTKSEAENMARSIGKPCYYNDQDGNPAMAIPSTNFKGVNEALKIRNSISQWRRVIEDNERKKYGYASGYGTPQKRYSVSSQPIEYSETACGYHTSYDYHTFGGKVTGGFSIGGGGKDNDSTQVSNKGAGNANANEVYVGGFAWSFKLNPLQTSYSNSISQTAYCKTLNGCGYKLDMRNNGYMDIDVYKEPGAMILNKKEWDWVTAEMNKDVTGGTKDTTVVNTGEYIYVLRGGAQRSPWYDADTSFVYTMAGKHVKLGERTKKIDNPKIYISNPVVSNVKRDGTAIYSVRLTNETEYNGDVSMLAPIPLLLRLDDKSNPNGAKILMDGAPIIDGRQFDLAPGKSITKTIEVTRGNGYDFEDIGLVFRDMSYTLIDTARFSVHFTPESTPVTLLQPRDKWVMNTLSDREKETGKYYLPVEIGGFDIKYDGFDHIELQYKKQTEGESKWVNLCSFYADQDKYEKASGVKKMISSNTISDFAFYGEKDTIEMKYDLRAVSFCRLGTGFVTRVSNVSSGIKDTRTPHVFGKPAPVNGILTYGDVISVPFNEPIAYNYLDRVANFSVRGFTNNSDANHSAKLRFNGGLDEYAETNVERSFKDTDFTIEMNAQVDKGSDAILFAMTEQHTDYEDLLAFAYSNADDALVGFANNKLFKSKPLRKAGLNINDVMTHVGMVYESENQNLWFIGGNDTISVASTEEFAPSENLLKPSDKITGTLVFGAPMNGYLSDVRIWHRALNSYEIANKFGKKLSAGEKDLMAWWPMDEAFGNTVVDKANGADLQLHNVSWETPKGFSAKLEGNPMNINKDIKLFQTEYNQDFTLAFWFKVDSLKRPVMEGDAVSDRPLVSLFAAGSESLSDKGEGKMRIGFDANNHLMLRTEGNNIDFGIGNDYVKTGQWHYLTLVSDHSQNLASLYIDGNMVNETTADRIGRITGTPITFGSEGYHGYIDEISMWHLALPQSYINDIKTTALTGKEKELNAYISFETDELQGDNLMKTVFSSLNQKVSEETGNIIGDVMFDPATVGHEEAIHAPMKRDVGIANIDFSWTCTDNALQINLLKRDADINNQRIDLVLRGVEDLQGNPMSNPLMWSVYVNKNVMKWKDKTIKRSIRYGEAETVEAHFENISGRSVNYTVDTGSSWLTLDKTMGLAGPLEEDGIKIKIGNGLAPGAYEAIINLTDEDGLTSKLFVVANVEADEPDWTVTTAQDYQESMSLTGQVMVDQAETKAVDTDERDIVAAFYDGVCLGKAHITSQGGKSAYVYLNIHGKQSMRDQTVQFYLWDSSRGEIRRLKLFDDTRITFCPDSVVGTHSKPVVFVCDNVGIQTMDLAQGWNWVSFNLRSAQAKGVKNLFIDNSVFSNGDIIKGSLGDARFAEYVAKYNSWSRGGDDMEIAIGNVYQIYVNKPTTVKFEGYEIADADRKVAFSKGAWSQLPYLLKVPQPVNIAMSDYHIGDKAKPGTIIKSHDEFAVADASGVWYGSLQYMRPGEGYFVNNVGDACVVRFTNNTPVYHPDAKTVRQTATGSRSIAKEYADAMPVIAVFGDDASAESGQTQDGDVLVAYCNGMEVGRAKASDLVTEDSKHNVYFLMVNARNGSNIQFAKERDGETIALTERTIEFISTGIVGTLDKPYVIDFSHNVKADVYDINGRRYEHPEKIRQSGVYIVDGCKVVRF